MIKRQKRTTAGNRNPLLNRRRSRLETLEARRLLAADLESDEQAGHEHDHFELGEYWTPESRGVTGLTGTPANVSAFRNLFSGVVEHLSANRAVFAAAPGGDVEFRVTSQHEDSISGATHVYLQQTLDGLDIVNAVANATFTAAGQLVEAYSSFVSTVLETSAVAKSPVEALAGLSEHFGWGALDTSAVQNVDSLVGDRPALHAPAISDTSIPYEAVYAPTEDGRIEPAWRLNVQLDDGDAWLDSIVSQVDGDVAHVSNWVSGAQYRVFAIPKENPYDGPRSIEVDPHDPVASPFGWHDTNAVNGPEFTITRGVNVHAYTDTDGNNLPDPLSEPDGGAGLVFSHPANFQQEPSTYSAAATTNLFYTTNVVADILENHGFDEASGNFQTTNYTGLGVAGDPVLAEAQDGGGVNNANFATPPDGTSPRMQMFLWNLTTPMRDGSFDNGIIAHEFGHGVTNRLTGGAANSGALQNIQSRGMGEGWSDYFALATTQKVGDQANDGRGIGTYALGQPSSGLGIRTQKYSYDMSINNHTLQDIEGSGSVHFIGETWAATLWDLHWALIDGSSLDNNLPLPGKGFDSDLHNGNGGNNDAMKLVIQALKLQPSNPNFIQARDAILAADQLLFNGKYQQTIWKVFARRGMGVGAVAGGSNQTGVTESFAEPIVGDLEFSKSKPLGSLVSRVTGMLPTIETTEIRELGFFAERDSRVAFHFDPQLDFATLTVEIRRGNGDVLVPATSSPAAGQPVVIPTTRIAGGGNYIIEITTDVPTDVHVDAVRNATLESEVGDSRPSMRLGLDDGFIPLGGGGINSVVGHTQLNTVASQYNNPGLFVDISTTGTALNLSDDGEALIETSIGNALFPAGWTTIGNNGGIISSELETLQQLFASNQSLDTQPRNALYPFWDDIDSDTGNVYFQERSISGVNALIVQWENRPRFSNIGNATFQLQLFQSGPVLARFVYQDVIFGNAAFDNGASATIGVVSSDGIANEVSFNTASVNNGDVIDFVAERDIDYYTFHGNAGDHIDVILDRLNGTQLDTPVMRLLSPDGLTLIGLANDKPLAGRTTVSNYDQGVLSAVLPSSGQYQVRLIGKGNYDYVVSVTENTAFDTENTIGTLAPFRTIELGNSTMGFMNGGNARDMVAVDLVAGQTVRIIGQTPFDHPNTIPANTLGMRINLQAPDLSIVASDQTPNANGVYIIQHTATQTGKYRIDLRRTSGSGEYHVRVLDWGSPLQFDSEQLVDEDYATLNGPEVSIFDGAGKTDPADAQYLEGSTVSLQAVAVPGATLAEGESIVSGNAIYTWDLDDDGEFDDAVGAFTSFVLGFVDSEQLRSVRVKVETALGVSISELVMSVGITPWRNRVIPTDVNGDGETTVLDALLVLNRRSAIGSPDLPAVSDHQRDTSLVDVNGDNRVSALDALWVLNRILERSELSVSIETPDESGEDRGSGSAGDEAFVATVPQTPSVSPIFAGGPSNSPDDIESVILAISEDEKEEAKSLDSTSVDAVIAGLI